MEHNTNINEILGVIGCCGYKVSWGTKKKLSVTQCRRCQAFGLVASCCNLQYHCVKCAKSHNPGECPRDIDRSMPLKCFNCGDEHVASSPDCPERKYYVSRLNSNNKNIKHKLSAHKATNLFSSNYQNKGVSFANLFNQVQNLGSSSANNNIEKTVRPEINKSSNNNLGELLSLSQELFGINFNTLSSQILNFLNKINSVQDIGTKYRCI